MRLGRADAPRMKRGSEKIIAELLLTTKAAVHSHKIKADTHALGSTIEGPIGW